MASKKAQPKPLSARKARALRVAASNTATQLNRAELANQELKRELGVTRQALTAAHEQLRTATTAGVVIATAGQDPKAKADRLARAVETIRSQEAGSRPPQPVSQVDAAVAALTFQADELAEDIARLKMRLTPVLAGTVPEPRNEDQAGSASPTGPLCDLVQALAAREAVLIGVRFAIQDLLTRLKL